jgi:hypothetical protein
MAMRELVRTAEFGRNLRFGADPDSPRPVNEAGFSIQTLSHEELDWRS